MGILRDGEKSVFIFLDVVSPTLDGSGAMLGFSYADGSGWSVKEYATATDDSYSLCQFYSE